MSGKIRAAVARSIIVLSRIFVVAALAATLSVVGANAAQAVPTGCETGGLGTDASWSQCSGGTGQHRVVIFCLRVRWPLPPIVYPVAGEWERPVGISTAQCNSILHVVVRTSIEKR